MNTSDKLSLFVELFVFVTYFVSTYKRQAVGAPGAVASLHRRACGGETSLRTAVTKSATCDVGIAQLYATSLIGLSCNKISA